jgi:hypothetical protein
MQSLHPKETHMQYKTIVLELLQQLPQMHDRLRKERLLLAAMEHFAQELKESHEALQQLLEQARPGSHPSQIASEALEMALMELEDRLPVVSLKSGQESLSLDEAIDFLRKHTSQD